MADYQFCDIDVFLQSTDDGFMSPDEYMQAIEPPVQKDIPMPEEYIIAHSTIDVQESNEGEITRLLRTAPGILPPVDRFSNTYKKPEPSKQPEVIVNRKGDKIPIILNGDFFGFNKNPQVEEMTNAIKNNLNASSGGSGRRNGLRSSASSNNNSFDEHDKRILTLISDDDGSDEDNCNVRSNIKDRPELGGNFKHLFCEFQGITRMN